MFVEVFFRPYSKTYYGRYFPEYKEHDIVHCARVFLYPHSDRQGGLLSYDKVLDTAIHEFCHHIQHSDSGFVRVNGVMHNEQFWKLYNHYKNRAAAMMLL